MLIWRESSCLVFASHRKVFANQGDLGGAERLARGWSDCPIIFQIIWLADYFGLETSPQDYYRLASGRVVSGCFSSYIRLFLAVNLDFRFGAFSFKEDVIVNCQATSFLNLHKIYFRVLRLCKMLYQTILRMYLLNDLNNFFDKCRVCLYWGRV